MWIGHKNKSIVLGSQRNSKKAKQRKLVEDMIGETMNRPGPGGGPRRYLTAFERE